ncbi:hypothetical protein QR680_010197 [Steinernema hermaphroditum]|uniref:N-acetyltransferase domain-containing protein n=1 Tax=Steinernema hermaphroditum TaxID=289476 RepID=A0AA39IN43_9BILA|nr:hypothetical protein QR680_010197 [Steinernema hermaphroditum]
MMERDPSTIIGTLSPYECPCNYHSLKNCLSGKFLELGVQFWHTKICDIDVYLTAGIRNSLPSFMILESKEPIIDARNDDFFPLFEDCLRTYPDVFERGVKMASSKVAQNAFQVFLKAQPGTFKPNYDPCSCFYMTQKQQDKVMDLHIALPEGYRFDKADIEKDAEIITNTWIHSGPNEIEQTIMKLKYNPSALVRRGEEAVGFEMANFFGAQNHLFVLEDHRRKGLGRAVELKMSQECIKAGMLPYKFVEHWNANVFQSAKKDPLWTEKADESGEPIIYEFTHYVPQ